MTGRLLEYAVAFVIGGVFLTLVGNAGVDGILLDDEFNLDDIAARPLLALLFFSIGGSGAVWEWRQLRRD